jgi:hypothetical protein
MSYCLAAYKASRSSNSEMVTIRDFADRVRVHVRLINARGVRLDSFLH